MDFNSNYSKHEKNIPANYPKSPLFSLLSPNNIIAIFTTLTILLKMKKQLGLEAMIEYMEFYILTIEKHNPRFKGAVEQALSMISVNRIYSAMDSKVPREGCAGDENK